MASKSLQTSATPGSPTLTNPDMTLSPRSENRDTPSPPPGNLPSVQRVSSFSAGKRRSVMEKPGLGPRLPIAGTARPSMPGSWQSESDTTDPTSLARRPSLQQPQSLSGKRLSRTGSLRASGALPWQRAASRDRPDNGYANSSLLGSGTRRLTLAERLEEEDPPDSPYTTTSESNADEDENDDISSKAEEILANAKKRLTAMEGNLNRARSLSATRGSSPASSASDLPPRYSKRVSRSSLLQGNSSWAMASSKLRQASLTGGSGHLRVFSETAASPKSQSASSPQRSMSALGHGSPTSPAMRTEWTDTSSSDSYTNGHSRYLEPLQEDDAYVDELASQPSQASPLLRNASNASLMYQTPTSSSSTLSRARSSIALRDLQEGVGDLKDKVQQLKERTKRDSMKRQSLQRLKTPSPFTSAESWVEQTSNESKTSAEAAVKITESTPPHHQAHFATVTPELREPLSAASSGSMYSTASNYISPVAQFGVKHGADFGDSPLLPIHPRIRHIPPTPTTPLKRHTPNQSTDSARTVDTIDSEPLSPTLSDAFPAPPDTTPTPPRSRSNSAARSRSNSAARPVRSRPTSSISQDAPLSHEDNPDAFDYSRFLLDSAMGTYALDKDRNQSRSPSSSSMGSQSTTRPRKSSTARLSKMSATSAASRASTAKRISLSPSERPRSRSSSSASNSGPTLAQRRASGRSNSSASLHSIVIPDGRRSASPGRSSGVSDATSPSTTLSPPSHGKGAHSRPGHARQSSTDSLSASSVASFATALERASSQLTIRSMSRSTLRNASVGAPTNRAGLEAYSSSRNSSFVSATSSYSPPDLLRSTNKTATERPESSRSATPTNEDESAAVAAANARLEESKRHTQDQLNALLIDEADALRTPTTPTLMSLPSSLSKASAAVLSAVLAVSHAAVREDDERRGFAPSTDAPRMMDPKDEAILGRVLEGILGAAVGLIGRSPSTGMDATAGPNNDHGSKGNSWRKSSISGTITEAESREIDERAVEQQRDIWRMRCEVARRALTEEKPGEGF